MKNVAVYIPPHTLSGEESYVNRGGGGSYGADYLKRIGDGKLNVTLVDGNIAGEEGAEYQQEALEKADVIFETFVGEVYIPGGLRDTEYRRKQGKEVIVGGPGVYHFTDNERAHICHKRPGEPIVRYMEEAKVSKILGVNYTVPTKQELSNNLILDQIPDNLRRRYLEKEICMYLADGCKFACDFCAVEDRTRKGSGKTAEKYRNLHKFTEELTFYANKAKSLGLNKLSIYFSNLDILQTPSKIIEASMIIKNISDMSGVNIQWRGLPTFDSINNFVKEQGFEWLQELNNNGLVALGPGADGYGPEIWKKLKKGHNTEKLLTTIPKILSDANITTEILMVFCHPGIDTKNTLKSAQNYLKAMHQEYGAVPRIHVAKSALAGSTGPTGWGSKFNQHAKHLQLNDPEHFLMKDFLARPNRLSHPYKEERNMFYDAVLDVEDMIKDWKYKEGVSPPSMTHDAVDPNDNFMKQMTPRLASMGKYDH